MSRAEYAFTQLDVAADAKLSEVAAEVANRFHTLQDAAAKFGHQIDPATLRVEPVEGGLRVSVERLRS